MLKKNLNSEHFASLAQEYELYAELPEKSQNDYIKSAITGVMEHLPELDSYIEKYAIGWNVGRISKISKCVLRLCMYELLYMGIPTGASVNEAVELIKLYEGEQAAQFINGIIGSFVKKELPDV